MLPISLTSLLLPLIYAFVDKKAPSSRPEESRGLRFELRHLHAVAPSSRVVFTDVRKGDLVRSSNQYDSMSYSGSPVPPPIRTRRTRTYRPTSWDAFSTARLRSLRFGQSQSLDWEGIEVDGPDHESRETLLLLAKMANNAYVMPDDAYWYDLGPDWNAVRLQQLSSQKLALITSLLSRFRMVGNPTRTVSGAMSLQRRITALSS
jgi:lipase ATG15